MVTGVGWDDSGRGKAGLGVGKGGGGAGEGARTRNRSMVAGEGRSTEGFKLPELDRVRVEWELPVPRKGKT